MGYFRPSQYFGAVPVEQLHEDGLDDSRMEAMFSEDPMLANDYYSNYKKVDTAGTSSQHHKADKENMKTYDKC